MRMPTGHWDLSTGPVLSGRALESYDEARAALKKGDLGRARDLALALAQQAATGHDQVLEAWFLAFAAEATIKGSDPTEGRALYHRAIDACSPQGDTWPVTTELWTRLGLSQLAARAFPEAQAAFAAALNGCNDRERELFAAFITLQLAAVEIQLGNPAKAHELASQALSVRERLAHDTLPVAVALNTVALAALYEYKYDEAQSAWTRATAIEDRDGREGTAYVTLLSNQCAVTRERGDLPKAEALCRKALDIQLRKDPRGLMTSAVEGNLAGVRALRGDIAEADSLNFHALEILKEKDPGSPDQGIFLMNLGIEAQMRGDGDSAASYYRAAVEIFRKVGDKDSLARCLINMSGASLDANRPLDAEQEARESIQIWEQIGGSGTPHGEAIASLAQALAKQKRYAEARELYRQANALFESAMPHSLYVAISDQLLGDLELDDGHYREAGDLFRSALAIRQRLSPDAAETAEVLYALSRIERTNHSAKALSLNLEALSVLDRQGGMQGGSQEAASATLQKHRPIYSQAVELLVEAGQPAEAFAVLERSRARTLLQLIAEKDLQFQTEAPPDLERERRRLNAAYDQTQNAIQAISAADAAQLDTLLAKLGDLHRQRQEIAIKIKESSPRYAELRYPQPLGLAEARASLDKDTLLLSFSVGKDKTFLFVVEPSQAKGSGLSIYAVTSEEEALREQIEAYRNVVDWQNLPSGGSRREPTHSLYDTLLKPAERAIAGYQHLLILPDGPLHTLPWSALVRGIKDGVPQYLAEWKPVHIAVSATVYAELKKERKEARAAPGIDVAAFGDPTYPKLPKKKIAAVKRGEAESKEADPLTDELAEVEDPQLRSAARSGYRLDPLPASRKEVEQIAGLYAPKSVAYLGPDATEEKAKSIGKNIPIIHFATHAIINERFPLDSALVFTIPEHPKEGQDNGLLQAWEIFESMRIDADLVTLSACDSGLGKEMGGEGLIGLTRAFQYAGARSVLASLWKVEDKATAELMKRFYTYLKGGMTKDEALRHAQIDLIHSKDYSNPRDWAAFQLNGDWK